LPVEANRIQRSVLTVGLPGSGKSTWIRQKGVHAISSDAIRTVLADDPTDQTIHGRVFATVRYLVRQRLAIDRPVTYVDATHLTRADRKPYVQLAEWYGCEIEAVVFPVPIDECLRRNALRARVVPEAAILTMAAKLEYPELSEGFSRISLEVSSRPIARS
jgi:predicted kinase